MSDGTYGCALHIAHIQLEIDPQIIVNAQSLIKSESEKDTLNFIKRLMKRREDIEALAASNGLRAIFSCQFKIIQTGLEC